MFTGVYLQNAVFSDEKGIHKDKFITINKMHRLYYKDEDGCLEFCLVEWVSGKGFTWDDCVVDIVCQYSAKYTGEVKRHMWWTPNDDGYCHLPDVAAITEALTHMEKMFQERLKSISQ